MVCSVNAQNLVPNHSFEDTLYTPNTNGIYPLFDWFIVGGSPEYFHPDNLFPFSLTPTNSYGTQEPFDGVAYAGIVAYVDWGPPNTLREFIGVRLIQPLESGVEYCVSFRASLPESCDYAITNLGAYFSVDTSFVDSFDILLSIIPQVENPSDNVLDDKDNWMLIEGSFIAVGGEEFLTIANFRHDSIALLTTTVVGDTSDNSFSYYYLDDVSVTEQSCAIDTAYLEIPNVFTPNNDGVNDVFTIKSHGMSELTCTIVNRWGQKTIDYNALQWNWDAHTTAGLPVPDGVYYYVVNGIDEDGEPILRRGSIQVLR